MKKSRYLQNLPNDAVYDEMDSPVGTLTLIASPKGLHNILWDLDRSYTLCEKMINSISKARNEEIIANTKQQLNEYFQGKRKKFDLLLAPIGTPFQLQAWQQLLEIPYSETISYGEQAQRMGDKNKSRAVGMANGRNPISIVIPCHRVIGHNGKLVGFGGGIERKEYLLQLEKNWKNSNDGY